MQSNATMKKIIIALSIVVVIAIGGLVALMVFFVNAQNSREPPQATIVESHAPAQNYANDESSELAAELAELQAMLNALLAEHEANVSAEIEPISGDEASVTALAQVGHGEVVGYLIFYDEGVLTFEIDIRYGMVRYMVYVNAENGSVTNTLRFEDTEASGQ